MQIPRQNIPELIWLIVFVACTVLFLLVFVIGMYYDGKKQRGFYHSSNAAKKQKACVTASYVFLGIMVLCFVAIPIFFK